MTEETLLSFPSPVEIRDIEEVFAKMFLLQNMYLGL